MSSLQMHPNRLLFSCFLLYFLIPNIGIQISLCTDDHPSYSNCKSSFNCGDITGVGYPFWGDGRSSNCGHPAFKLHCSGNSTSIQIMSQWFRVKQIHLENKILKIARADFVEGLCPKLFKNTTIDFNLFSYTPSDEIATLFYRCASIPIVSMAPNSFTCGTDGDDGLSTAYFFPATVLLNIEQLGLCKIRVTVPILQETARAIMREGLENPWKKLSIGEALKEGFEVQWTVEMEGCRGCIKAGGYCGYNWSLNGFTCFCNNQSNGRSCSVPPAPVISTISIATHNTGEKINWKRKLKIGFSAAGAGILLTCLGFFIYHRYKRQQSTSPALLSQDNSSSPSSKIKTDLEKGSTHFGVHIFTYEELEEATENFHPSKELGDGGFGTVYHGKLRDGREVAVKRLYEHNFKRVEQFMNEVEILNHLWHQNLVTLYGCTSRHSHELLLVYEFIPNGTVADNLHGDRTQPGALKWPIRMNIAVQTASALAYLHASDVVHRDVKTNNILLDNNFHVKVADFGLSRLFPMDVTHISTAPQGTPGYLDPEYHQCYQLTEKSDVYSFGVVLVELISSKPAVDITRHQQEINLAKMAINKIQNCVLHEFVDPYLGFESDEIIRNKIKLVAELAFRCLQYEKELRPPMYEVFKILMRIERQDGKTEKVDSPKDDIGSLKNIPQMLSPDSLTDKWASRSTTPNGSS